MRPTVLALATLLALLTSSVASADTDVPSSKLFSTASARVRGDVSADKFLSAVAQHLGQDRDRRLRIVVHTDERPGAVDNTVLADLRAKGLVKDLKKRGVKKSQLTTEAVGHSGVEHTPETARVIFDFADDTYVAWPGETAAP